MKKTARTFLCARFLVLIMSFRGVRIYAVSALPKTNLANFLRHLSISVI